VTGECAAIITSTTGGGVSFGFGVFGLSLQEKKGRVQVTTKKQKTKERNKAVEFLKTIHKR